jgi:hypothetical protein
VNSLSDILDDMFDEEEEYDDRLDDISGEEDPWFRFFRGRYDWSFLRPDTEIMRPIRENIAPPPSTPEPITSPMTLSPTVTNAGDVDVDVPGMSLDGNHP